MDGDDWKSTGRDAAHDDIARHGAPCATLDEARRRAAEPVRIGPVAAMRWGDGPDGFALSREALLAEMARYGSAGRSDDYTDALALAWQSAPDAWVRRAAIERRAVERTGRVLVAWLIGRWRR